MKVFVVLCSLLTAAVTQEPSLSCRYYFNGDSYSCELTLTNPNGFNNFTEIGGTHFQGFGDTDVTELFNGGNVNTRNIPQIICDTFPNIDYFQMYNANIEEIDDNALRGCSRIETLYFFYNRIRSISENAFVSLRNVSYINLGENSLTTLPENVFANQQNLTELSLSYNPFVDIPTGLFRPLENLLYLHLVDTNLSAINYSQWFTANSNLYYLNLANNRITLEADIFPRIDSLRHLSLAQNGLTEIPEGSIFAGLPNLQSIELYGNNFNVIRANAFPNLGQLVSLDIGDNPIETIEAGAFAGLERLNGLYLYQCRLTQLNSNAFEGLTNLTDIQLGFNTLEELPLGLFSTMPDLRYIGLWNNRIKTLRRGSFGELDQVETIDLDGNIINALDREIVDDAVSLETLFFGGNLCANQYFGNFLVSRATYLIMLERCFDNMRFVVDTTTENNGIYSFFNGPQPGIVLRVQSNNEVQIALTPFNFLWMPSIEIFIGAANNTRSVIRINEETDVVTVPTPNIIQENQGNDFRITWANQNVLVFRGNEPFPFMSYTMQNFFPVNFYGLRAVETEATWSIQPLS